MYKVPIPIIDWPVLIPVVTMFVTGLVGIIFEMINPKKSSSAIATVSVAGVLATLGVLVGQLLTKGPSETFAGMIVRDGIGLVLQMAIVTVAFITILFSESYLKEKRINFGEFYPLVVWSASGAMLMVSTFNMLMMFIGLEVLSISLYVLAGLSRRETKSEESAIKYFLLGAFASAFFLYGIAFFYGATGSVHLGALDTAWREGSVMTRNLLLFGFAMLFIGFGFKSALVPFHQWAPDVYQGAPTNVTGFMAAGSKIAAIGGLLRVLDACPGMSAAFVPALTFIAILTMTVGNIAACVQKDVKRILGYSSVSNAVYVLAALIAHAKMPAKVNESATLFFLLSYALMTLGAFAVVSLVAKDGKEGTTLADMRGLWKRAPLAAGALILFVASLIGIPGTGGFLAKYYIFSDLLTADLLPLAIALAINSIISVYYYLGIVQAAVVSEEGAIKNESAEMSPGNLTATVLCAVGVLALFFLNSPVMNLMGVVSR